jgi:GT2 family glycosyltransferase
MTFPIIIVNWKGLHDTIECVNSLLLYSESDFRIYLIDNFSNDGSIEALQNLFGNHPKITLVQNSSNLGFTGAHIEILHQLLDQNYPYVALLNNDT